MTDVRESQQAAAALVAEVSELLDAYLAIDSKVFSWKNTFGWNNVEPLVPQIQPLVDKLTELTRQAKALQEAVNALPEEVATRQGLIEFYKLFVTYAEALKFAVQSLGRVIGHIDTKRKNKAEYKQVRYESDLMIYKSQIDKYQLLGEKLNKLIKQL